MAKTRIVKGFQMVGTLLGGDSVPTISLPCSASTAGTFSVGMPVMWDDGYVSVHSGSTKATILGFAASAGNGLASDGLENVLIWPATPYGIYEGSAVATATTSHTLVQTNFGDIFGLVLYTPDTPDVWAIDISEVTTVLFRLLRPGKGDQGDAECAIGDINPRVLFTIPASACELFTTTATT